MLDRTEISTARCADISEWILEHHPEDVIKEGNNSLRMKSDPSVNMRIGYSGYKDFSTGETGNPIDFLMNYYDYDFIEAVNELNSISSSFPSPPTTDIRPPSAKEKKKNFELPESTDGSYKQLFAYLKYTRCIPEWIIRKLIREKAIYQEKDHNNIVFRSYQNDFAEVRGTLSSKPFHGVVPGSNPLGFFWFKNGDRFSKTERAFICEASIDAISLFALHQYNVVSVKKGDDAEHLAKMEAPTLYISIAGAGNYGKVTSIQKRYGSRPIYLAVDNDEAGEKLRNRYPEIPAVIPEHKDWNEDLISIVTNLQC